MSQSIDHTRRRKSRDRRRELRLERLEGRILLSVPQVYSLNDTPDPVTANEELTLALEGGTQHGDRADFYRSTDDSFDAGTDPQLDAQYVSQVSDGWEWQGPADWQPGQWHYYARAVDELQGGGEDYSAVMHTTGKVNARPTINAISGSPEPITSGETLTLTAQGVQDSDGSVRQVDFYHDADDDGVYDAGQEDYLGTDIDGTNGWTWTGEVEWSVGDYFAIATDNDGAQSSPIRGFVDQKPIIDALTNDPNPIHRNDLVTFTATGVSDPDGTVTEVLFYRDKNNSGQLETDTDGPPLGSGQDLGGGTWELQVRADWDPDVSPLYFAVAKDDGNPDDPDDKGFFGDPVATLNQNPYLDELLASPNPVAMNQDLLLEALGVEDADGYVEDVVFSVGEGSGQYAGTPNLGGGLWPDFGLPTTWHVDGDETNGWTWSLDGLPESEPVWTIRSVHQADFDQDGDMDAAVVADVPRSIGNDFVSVLLNDGRGTFRGDSLVTLHFPLWQSHPDPTNPSSIPFYDEQLDPVDLVAGDFNEDGYPDIATANSNVDHISVLLNDGSGGFNSYQNIEVDFSAARAVHPDSITTGDYTGDGHLDIAVASSIDDQISLLWGDGNGGFSLNRIYQYSAVGNPPPVSLDPEDMTSADLDLYGGSDIITASQKGPMILWAVPGRGGTQMPHYFDPGNKMGRALETGITGGRTQTVQYDEIYRTGLGHGRVCSRGDDYFHQWVADGDVDMYHVMLEQGQTLTADLARIPECGQSAGDIYMYVYNVSGQVMASNEVGDDLIYQDFAFSAPQAGHYFFAVAGNDLTPDNDPWFNPRTAEHQPDGGTDNEYNLTLTAQMTATYTYPVDTPLNGNDLGVPSDGTQGIQGYWVLYDDSGSTQNEWEAGEDVWADGTGGGWRNQLYDEEIQIDPGANLVWETTAGSLLLPSGAALFNDAAGDADGFFDLDEEVWIDNGTVTGEYDVDDTTIWAGGDVNWDTNTGDPGIAGNVHVSDLDGSGDYDDEDEVWSDTSYIQNGQYDHIQEIRLNDGGDGWDIWDGALGIQDNVYWYGQRGETWDAFDFVWADSNTSGEYEAGQDAKLYDDDLWPPGTQSNLFFEDTNQDGIWSAGEGVWADSGTIPSMYDGGDRVIYGSPTFFAQGTVGNIYYNDSDNDGMPDPKEGVWAEDVSGGVTPEKPFGYGDSVVAADFMEDDPDLYPAGVRLDIDLAFANSQTGEVSVLLGVRHTEGPIAYIGLYPRQDSDWFTPQNYKTTAPPLSLTVHNVDGDESRDSVAEDDWDWRQGSVEDGDNWPEFGSYRPFPDLIVTTTRGSVDVFLNEGEHSGNFGLHEFSYDGDFNDTHISYTIGDYSREGPFNFTSDAMISGGDLLIADDFNGDNLASFVVAENLNLAVVEQAYPFHMSDPADHDQYESEVPQIGERFGFRGRYSIMPWDEPQKTITYYARAFDEDYGWWNNLAYEGYSRIGSVDVALNQRPLIWTLQDNRNEVLSYGTDVLTLTARRVQDLDGFVDSVEFYMDTDGDPLSLDPQNDHLIGADDNGTDGWSRTVSPGTLTWGPDTVFWARPIDQQGAAGKAVDSHLNERPEIGHLYVDGWYKVRSDFNPIYENEEQSDPDAYDNGDQPAVGSPTAGAFGIRGNILFRETIFNTRWDAGEEIWADGLGPGAVANGVYDEEIQVCDADGLWTTVPGTAGDQGGVIFRDADGDGRLDRGEEVWLDDGNGTYDPDPLIDTQICDGGDGEWNTSEGAAGITGNVYWNDFGGDGFTPGTDEIWADSTVGTTGQYDDIQETRVYDGGDGQWNTSDGAAGLVGNLLFQDDDTDGEWDSGEAVWAEQVEEQSTLHLTAVDVRPGYWAGGEEIWIDADNGLYNTGEPQLNDGGDGTWDTADGTAGSADTFLFRDMNADGKWSAGEEVWLDDGDNIYDAGDTQVHDGGDGTWNTPIDSKGLTDSFLFNDTSGDGSWAAGEEVWLDSDNQSYDAGETQVFDGDDNGWDTAQGASGVTGNFLFNDLNSNGLWETNEEIWLDEGNGTYDGGETRVYDGGDHEWDTVAAWDDPTSTWDDTSGVEGRFVFNDTNGDGQWNAGSRVRKVQIYRDSNFNSVFDPQQDELLTRVNLADFRLDTPADRAGTMTVPPENMSIGYDRGDPNLPDWRIQIDLVDWEPGSHTYFAVAQDSADSWSTVVSARNEVTNIHPVAGSLNTSPEPVTRGDDITLTAEGVNDPYGEVHSVVFYLDDGDGSFSAADERIIGIDPSDAGGWSISEQVDWLPGTHTYFARAKDNYGDWSNVVSVTGNVNSRPIMGGEMDFTSVDSFAANASPAAIATGDFNDDDNLDAAVANLGSNTVSVLYGNGDGTFQTAQTYDVSDASVVYLTSTDFDGDGLLDLVTANRSSNAVSILINNGQDGFDEDGHFLTDVAPEQVGIGDFNRDGNLDVAVAGSRSGQGEFSLWLQDVDGNLTFAKKLSEPLGGATASAIQVGHFDTTDQRLDVAVAVPGAGNVSVWKGQPDDTFSKSQDLAVGTDPVSLASGDYNEDGILDLAVALRGDDAVRAYSGVGDGTFDPASMRQFSTPGSPEHLTTGYLDQDPRPDLAVATSGNDRVHVLLAQGGREDGTGAWFVVDDAYDVGSGPVAVAAGDFDADSVADLVTADQTAGTMTLLPGVGSLTDENYDPVDQASQIVLKARNLRDPDGDAIENVEFYRDSNGTGVLEPGEDLKLDQNQVLRRWTFEDLNENGAFDAGEPALAVWAGTSPYDSAQDTAIVGSPADGTLGIKTNLLFSDVNDNGQWDSGEDVWADGTARQPANGIYDSGDVVVDDGGDGWTTQTGDAGIAGNLRVTKVDGSGTWWWKGTVEWPVGDQIYFARAIDARGGWSRVAAETGRVENPQPVIGELVDDPDPVTEGYQLKLIAQDVIDPNGTVEKVEFYLDDGDSSLDPAQDTLLKTALTPDGGNWVISNQVNWSPGTHTYFARAQDNQGAWSEAAFETGYVNDRPTITNLVATPNPLPWGMDLTLTAEGVQDPDGVQKVEFYRDTNQDGTFQASRDAIVGTDESATDGWQVTFAPTTNIDTFFARAFDGTGYSFPATATINRLPTIGELSDTPDPVNRYSSLRLEATAVRDRDGTIDVVQFYRDMDKDGVLDPEEISSPLGTDSTAGDGWYWQGPADWPGGRWTYFALARDNRGDWMRASDAARTIGSVNSLPVIDETAFTDTPDPVTRGEVLTLSVAANATQGTTGNFLFADASSDGSWQLDEEVWHDEGDGLYGTGDVTIYDGGDGTWDTPDGTAGTTDSFLFNDADSDGSWQQDEEVWLDTGNGRYDVGEIQVYDGGDGSWESHAGVRDRDGSVEKVEFWRDQNGNGTLETSIDTPLGTDSDTTDGAYNISKSTGDWNLGTQTYFARAQDNNGAWSPVVITTGRVNDRPVVGGLTVQPDPVSQGSDVTLTAVGVSDRWGVTRVRFYHDGHGTDPADGSWSSDELVGTVRADGLITGLSGPAPSTQVIYGARGNLLFNDLNGDYRWDAGEEIWLDGTGDGTLNGQYESGETQLYDGGDETWDTAEGTAGIHGNLLFEDSDGDGSRDSGEGMWAEIGEYNYGQDTLVPDTTQPAYGTIGARGALLFDDADGSDTWNEGEAIWLDANGDGLFNTGETVAYGVAPSDGTGGIVGNLLYDAGGNGQWDPGEGIWAESDSYNEWKFTLPTKPEAKFPTGLNRYFARAQDTDGVWSEAAMGTGDVNAPPVIGTLTHSPDPGPLLRGQEPLTIVAGGITDTESDPIQDVAFYLDMDLDGEPEPSDRLPVDDYVTEESNDTWTWSGPTQGFPAGSVDIWARARDEYGWGDYKNDIVDIDNAGPTMTGDLVDDPDPVTRPDTLTLTANGVTDKDGEGISTVHFYHEAEPQIFPGDNDVWNVGVGQAGATGNFLFNDTDASGAWNEGEEVWVDDGNGTYDAGEFQLYDGGDGSWDTAAGTAGQAGDFLYYDVDDSLDWTQDDDVWFDEDGNGSYDAQPLVGTVTQVDADTWMWEGSTMGFPLGTSLYLAQAEDTDGALSNNILTTTGEVVNAPPVIQSLDAVPDRVAPGDDVFFNTLGVSDPDGTVVLVEFYDDLNHNGIVDAGDPLVASDDDGSDGWSSSTSTAGAGFGTHTYLAVATDNDGGQSDPVSDTVEISYTLIRSRTLYNNTTISFYDVDQSNGVSDPDIAWGVDEYNRQTDILVIDSLVRVGRFGGIHLFGDGTETQDLGISVSGRNGFQKFVDHRAGADQYPVAFLAVQKDVGWASFRNGLEGSIINGFVDDAPEPRRWYLPSDVDGDGNYGDATGLYAGSVGTVVLRGDVQGDVVSGWDANLVYSTGDLPVDVRAGNNIGTVLAYGDVGRAGGGVAAGGSIGRVYAVGGNMEGGISSGSNLNVAAALQRLARGGSIKGAVDVGGNLGVLRAVGGDVSGDVTANGDINRLVVVRGDLLGNVQTQSSDLGVLWVAGGDIEGDVTVNGHAGYVIAARLNGEGGAIRGAVDVEADLTLLKAAGGSVSNSVNVGGNLGALTVLNGDLAGPVVTGDVTGQGKLQSLRVTGGDIQADVTVNGRAGVLVAAALDGTGGNIVGNVQADSGLGTLWATGNLQGDVSVTSGDLSRVVVRGNIQASTVSVDNGSLSALNAGGRIENSLINVQNRVGYIVSRGDFLESSVEANRLGRVLVRGTISGTGGDDNIHARDAGSSFFARDRLSPLGKYWIDKDNEHDFNGVRAYAG